MFGISLVLGAWCLELSRVPRTAELQIHDVAFGGKGVARDAGKALFVPFTIEGERVSARIIREKKQFAEAELVEILEPSSYREPAPCPYFGRCGGCSHPHNPHPPQLEFKKRQGGETPPPPPRPPPPPPPPPPSPPPLPSLPP